ncbi:hypothetical protein [Clostridium sp. UBA4548]|uniref:hypothetical protein n=1 Tax=Clostridium sp. UBA4548 TaxID=1946361 RepID=UPI0025C5FDA5|nr:hypothetical protein [Clostridium sp. UBA4548]
MLQIERELLRLQILLELYEFLFCVCDYRNIQRQEYIIPDERRCEIIAALYYLDDRGLITVRNTDRENVLIIYIRSRGIDEVELKIRKATTVALASSYNQILMPNFDDVPENDLNKDYCNYCCKDNSKNKSKDSEKDKSKDS